MDIARIGYAMCLPADKVRTACADTASADPLFTLPIATSVGDILERFHIYKRRGSKVRMSSQAKMDDARREQSVLDYLADELVRNHGIDPLTAEEKEVMGNLNPRDLYEPDIGERIKRMAREAKSIVEQGRESKDE